MSRDWLVKMAEKAVPDEVVLEEALSTLPYEDLYDLSAEEGVVEREDQLDVMQAKMAQADQMGRELAHLHGDELEKEAFLPLLAGLAGRAVGGGLLRKAVGGIVKDKAIGAVGSAIGSGVQKARQGFQQPAAQQVAKFASSKSQEIDHEAFDSAIRSVQNPVQRVMGHPLTGAAIGAGMGAMMFPEAPLLSAGGGAAVGALGNWAGGRLGGALAKKIPQKAWDPRFRSAYEAALKERAGKEKTALLGAGGLKGLGASLASRGSTLARGATNMMASDPRKALALGGAAVGAAQGLMRDPGYDEYGNRKSRLGAAAKGAVGGGAIGYGVGSIKGVQGAIQGAGKSMGGQLAAGAKKLSPQEMAHVAENMRSAPHVQAPAAAPAADDRALFNIHGGSTAPPLARTPATEIPPEVMAQLGTPGTGEGSGLMQPKKSRLGALVDDMRRVPKNLGFGNAKLAPAAGWQQWQESAPAIKTANRQTLTIGPGGQLTRHHLTPSLASQNRVTGGTLADIGAGNIQPGHSEPVQMRGTARPMPSSSMAPSSLQRSQGDVVSSAPRPAPAMAQPRQAATQTQIPANRATPPPIPAAARRGAAGVGASKGFPSLAGAKSIAGGGIPRAGGFAKALSKVR